MITLLFVHRNTGVSFRHTLPADWQLSSILQYCKVFNVDAEILSVVP
jgi:hypothetical protein